MNIMSGLSFIISKNLSVSDKIKGFFKALDIFCKINSIRVFLRFSKTYSNSIEIFRNERVKKYPINVILKNGTKLLLHKKKDISLLTHNLMWKKCKFNDELLEINWKGRNVFFTNSEFGDIVAVFAYERYSIVSVKNKIVIDIGAAIGDSAIYFAINSAKAVIAVEPFPKNIEIAEKNIKINNMSDKISLIHGAISNKKGKMRIDENAVGPGTRTLSNKINGTEIQTFSLKDIIPENEKDMILKIDCEGCEYQIILETEDEILLKFQTIMLEYHFGYQNLKLKLESIGFDVKITGPEHVFREKPYYGYLIANKRQKLNL